MAQNWFWTGSGLDYRQQIVIYTKNEKGCRRCFFLGDIAKAK